jgi:uncharacterized protein YdgA (DUF945 family)
MKKRFSICAAAALLLAGAWLGASWYTGRQLQAHALDQVAAINRMLQVQFAGYGVSVKLDSYRRGLFASRARYALHFDPAGMSAELLGPLPDLDFEARIEHGPFPWGALVAGYVAPTLAYVQVRPTGAGVARDGSHDTSPSAEPTLSLAWSYYGDAVYTWRVPAFTAEREHVRLHFGAVRGQGRYVAATQAVRMHLRAEPLSVLAGPGEPYTLALDGADADLDSRPGKFGMAIGRADLAIGHATLSRAGARYALGLDDLHGYSDAAENDTSLSGQMGLTAGAFKLNDVALGAARMVFKFERFDGPGLSGLSHAMAADAEQDVLDAADADADPVEAAANQQNIARLLAGNPSFSLDPLGLSTPQGELRLAVSVSLHTPAKAAAHTLWPAVQQVNADWRLSRAAIKGLLVQWLHARGVKQANLQAVVAQRVDDWSQKAVLTQFATLDGDALVGRLRYRGAGVPGGDSAVGSAGGNPGSNQGGNQGGNQDDKPSIDLNGERMPAERFLQPFIYLLYSAIGTIDALGD